MDIEKIKKIAKYLVLFLLVGALLFTIYWLAIRKKDNDDNNISRKTNYATFNLKKPSVKMESEIRNFYTIESTDGKVGINRDGDLIVNNEIVENGYKTREQLQKYLLTYPIGHPHYKKSHFGYLNSNSWKDHMSRFKYKVSQMVDISNSKDKVLVIEANGEPSPVVLDTDINVKGIVIRRGGILLVDGKDITIKTEFILVESGGLFQAGSSLYPGYRFKHNLKIILTNPQFGYKYMGVVASQYSYKVYFPGVKIDEKKPVNDFTDHLGDTGAFINGFGAKVIAAGFNGSIHLAGSIGTPKPYYGTWSADEIDSNGNSKPFVDESRLLTYFDNSDEKQKETAKIVNIATEYPNVWCRLKDGKYKNTSVIYLDPRDIGDNILSEWTPGKQIVITTKKTPFMTRDDPRGTVPIWLDYQDRDEQDIRNRKGNQQANDKLIGTKKDDGGVEVATIKSIERSTGKIELKYPLKFNHDSTRVILNNGDKKIRIDTNLHVALLTRNILITSERLSTPETSPGCNIWRTQVDNNRKEGEFKGPGGHINCNYIGLDSGNITNRCYDNREKISKDEKQNEKWFCGDNPEAIMPTPKGHWLIGTEGLQGCNALQGGSTMFRYGSSVRIDSVEMKYMGQPSNFGTIARYAIHFHLMGWIKTFRGYLPPTNDINDLDYRREGIVCNCSIWCTPTRWLVLHGSSEATIRNNVGFICYGSGYFVEDGTELNNTFEHNAAICCMPTRIHEYTNPIPLFSNTASDLAVGSCFWYKNNHTISIRNLGCCSPLSVIHTWTVAQDISGLRGPSSVCIGDENLGLPALGSQKNARSNLNQNNQNNVGGKLNKYTTNTLCWMPDYFKDKAIADDQLCVSFATKNCDNPIMANAENIAYCIAGAYSEFPEGTGDIPPTNYVGDNAMLGATNNIVFNASKKNPKAQFLPFNAENSCTDKMAQCVYPEHQWGAESYNKIISNPSYRFQPISKEELKKINSTNYVVRGIDNRTTLTPKIFSNWLTFNLGPNGGTLYGGSGWSKGSPTFLIGCCLLKTGGGVVYPQPGKGLASTSDELSSVWALTTGDAVHAYPNSYYVIYDLISNGGVAIPSSTTWIGGNKTFLDNEAIAYPFEYTNMDYQATTYYFSDINPKNIMNPKFVSRMLGNSNNVIKIYDIDKNTQFYLSADGKPYKESRINFSNTTKFPYLCKNQDLFKMSQVPEDQKHFDAKNPEWLGIVINSQNNSFLSNYARNIFGKKLCTNLSKIIGCETPKSFVNKNTHNHKVKC